MELLLRSVVASRAAAGGVTPFLIDGGVLTTLLFKEKLTIPRCAIFTVLQTEVGERALRKYFRSYLSLAENLGCGFIAETPTWRASAKWASELGITMEVLDSLNCKAVSLMQGIREEGNTAHVPVAVWGQIGPVADSYSGNQQFAVDEARKYHSHQVKVLADAGVECISANSMGTPQEAAGVALAAKEVSLPCVVSFTLQHTGLLPCGATLESAIAECDRITDNYVSFFMVNCIHPAHLLPVLTSSVNDSAAGARLVGLRCNASRKTQQELDGSPVLDDGNPQQFGCEHKLLKDNFVGNFCVVGGCCGTDTRHVESAAKAIFF